MNLEKISPIQKVLPSAKSEIAKLAAELIECNRQLTLQNEEMEKRAAELIEINKELKEAKYQLELSNRELEAFSYSVAHDMRTPLRGVGSYSQMLREDYTDVLDTNGRRLLDTIQKSADKMGMLIDDMLSLSRLGKIEMRIGSVNMTNAVMRVVDEYKQAKNYKAEIITQPLPTANADPSMLYHVLVNLIGNALKYSAKNETPRIEISSFEENGEVVFCIADNGVGFDMKYAHKLFGVFQRLHSERDFEGTGVGLATVKRIIDRHGTRIWAHSEVGKGSRFYFTLPQNNAH